ncbi:MAG: hypothetical protein RIS56_2598 [Verrucomicrobiota bacterium]|jgi:hypothetical protein
MSFWELVRVLKEIGHEPVAPQKSGAHFLKNWARATDTIPVNLAYPTPPSRKRLARLSLIRIQEPEGEVLEAQARCGCVGLPTEFEHFVGASYVLGVRSKMGLLFIPNFYPCS